jgi:ClpX C4-type zinc finger
MRTPEKTLQQKAADTGWRTLYCSFCGRSQQEVVRLVTGPACAICDTCIDLAHAIVHGGDIDYGKAAGPWFQTQNLVDGATIGDSGPPNETVAKQERAPHLRPASSPVPEVAPKLGDGEHLSIRSDP